MTEAEAKTKWCHQARFTGTPSDDLVPNRSDPIEDSTRCIASDCMAWRWSEPKRTAAFLEAVQKHMRAQDKPNFNTAVQKVYAETGGQFERVEGHCGLGGAQ